VRRSWVCVLVAFEPEGRDQRRDERGFGFISREVGDEVFVHDSNIEGYGRRSLAEGDRVELETGPGRKGEEARNVRVIGASPSGSGEMNRQFAPAVHFRFSCLPTVGAQRKGLPDARVYRDAGEDLADRSRPARSQDAHLARLLPYRRLGARREGRRQ
jgi:cold shock protein